MGKLRPREATCFAQGHAAREGAVGAKPGGTLEGHPVSEHGPRGGAWQHTPRPCPGDKCVEHQTLPRTGCTGYFEFSHMTQATRIWGDPGHWLCWEPSLWQQLRGVTRVSRVETGEQRPSPEACGVGAQLWAEGPWGVWSEGLGEASSQGGTWGLARSDRGTNILPDCQPLRQGPRSWWGWEPQKQVRAAGSHGRCATSW